MRARNNKIVLLFLTYIVMIVAKFITFILPAKYTYDNSRIVSMVNQDGLMPAWSGSYETTADVFRYINVLQFQTLLEWSLSLGIILTTLAASLIFINCNLDFYQEVFWLCCIGLLNIYVFNIGKDSIQFCFFFLAFLIGISLISIPMKLFLITILFMIESIYFREYYIIVAAFFVAIIALTYVLHRSKRSVKIYKYITFILVIVYAFLILSSIVAPEQYREVASAREGVNKNREGSADAATLISNLYPGNTLISALINYPINAARMLIPVELLFKGLNYLPFVVFQLLVTVYLIYCTRLVFSHFVLDNSYLIIYTIFISFILTSFFFEPDFGSWVRHEIASFPVFQYLFFSKYCKNIFINKRIPQKVIQ